MKEICTRWVPKFFTLLQHANRVDCCDEFLENYHQGPTGFFGCIVTGDETWMHHYDAPGQKQAKTWKKPGEKTPTRSRTTRERLASLS